MIPRLSPNPYHSPLVPWPPAFPGGSAPPELPGRWWRCLRGAGTRRCSLRGCRRRPASFWQRSPPTLKCNPCSWLEREERRWVRRRPIRFTPPEKCPTGEYWGGGLGGSAALKHRGANASELLRLLVCGNKNRNLIRAKVRDKCCYFELPCAKNFPDLIRSW